MKAIRTLLFPFVLFFVAASLFAQTVDIVTLKNIPYVRDGGERRQLDLYLPGNYETLERPLPLVVLIHGGGWRNGSKDGTRFVNLARSFVQDGYAAAVINYRLFPAHPMPAQIIDCKSAVRWLRAHAGKYHLRSDRFGAMGSSAGGHLAALLGTTGQNKEFDQGEFLDESSEIQAVCDLCGPSDFSVFRTDRPSLFQGLFGDDAEEEGKLLQTMSPCYQANAMSAPMLMIHAVDDKSVPIEQSRKLYKILQEHRVPSELIELESGGHGSKEFGSPATKKRIREFFEKHLH